MDEHRDMAPPRYTSRVSGSAYDPETNRTTTVRAGPGIFGRLVEIGNMIRGH